MLGVIYAVCFHHSLICQVYKLESRARLTYPRPLRASSCGSALMADPVDNAIQQDGSRNNSTEWPSSTPLRPTRRQLGQTNEVRWAALGICNDEIASPGSSNLPFDI